MANEENATDEPVSNTGIQQLRQHQDKPSKSNSDKSMIANEIPSKSAPRLWTNPHRGAREFLTKRYEEEHKGMWKSSRGLITGKLDRDIELAIQKLKDSGKLSPTDEELIQYLRGG